jgi:hypothetical protein
MLCNIGRKKLGNYFGKDYLHVPSYGDLTSRNNFFCVHDYVCCILFSEYTAIV